MKKLILFFCFTIYLLHYAYPQAVAINSTGDQPDPSAILDVSSTTKGLLIPRMTTAQRSAIALPATGLIVYDNNTASFWVKSAGNWIELVDSSNNVWKKNGTNAYLGVTGRVGIGLTNPGYDIEIKRNDPQIGLYDLNDNHFSGSIIGDSSDLKINAYQKPFLGANVAGNLLMQVNDGVGLGSFISGNVGIGTAYPKAKLHISSSVLIGIGPDNAKGGLHLFNNSLYMDDGSNNKAIILLPNGTSNDGEIQLFEDGGDSTIILRASDGAGQGGEIIFIDPSDKSRTLEIDGDYASTGRSRIIVDELQIKGGADLAEFFTISTFKNVKPVPGMLVSIDENNPGKLIVTSRAYDKKVAGVVSGANGIRPGMMMGQNSTIADGDWAVALSGRVYVNAETSQNTINPGDLLTSSNIPGYAMKSTDQRRGRGSVIGKAMSTLKNGTTGLVLVLLDLQ